MDFSVLRVDPITGKVSFKLQSKKVAGFDKLIQIVVLELLSNQESSLLDPSSGGSIAEMIGSNFDPTNLSDLTADLTRKVRKVQTDIISNQIGLNLSMEEKLRRIDVLAITQDADLDKVALRIKIHNEAGRTRNIVV